MVPPLRRRPSTKTSSFIEKRKAVLKVEDPEHFTIAQLKATLRAANVSEHDISLCIERSQLNTLYKERLDTEFKACVVVQRHWRRVLDSRRRDRLFQKEELALFRMRKEVSAQVLSRFLPEDCCEVVVALLTL
jgi:hypothetical protein